MHLPASVLAVAVALSVCRKLSAGRSALTRARVRAWITTTTVPAATRLELPAGGDFTLSLADSEGRLLMLERRGEQLALTRRDAVSPFLDAVCRTRLAQEHGLSVWLDYGSIELLDQTGTLALTMQHRMAGEHWSLRYRTGA